MSFCKKCSRTNSSDSNSDKRKSDICVSGCPKSRGPHPVKRRKYKAGELNTTDVQCDEETDDHVDSANCPVQSQNVQCDLEPESDDDDDSVCSACKCTPGFCTERCESAQKKMSRNKSDSWKGKPAITAPAKQSSAPGLGAQGGTPQTCKCVGKCTKECEKMKMEKAMEAMKKSGTKCKENQCRSACNIQVQTDMDEPPIAPLAPVPLVPQGSKVNAKSEASSVCVSCQCEGICNVRCMVKRDGVKELITDEDFEMTTKSSTKSSKSCAKCTCTGECTPECMKQKTERQNQTENTVSMTNCETTCKFCDQFKDTQTNLNEKKSQGVICQLCTCSGACTQACRNANKIAAKEQNEPKQDADGNVKKVCKDCKCAKDCNEDCQSAKIEAQRICEECFCKATCKPKCAEKKESRRVCTTCECCGKCTDECELKKVKKRKSSKELKFDNVPTKEERAKDVENPDETTTEEGTTQVNGIIEDFNDEKLIAHADDTKQGNTKAKSSCDVPDEPICETCKCTDTCQPKCAAIRIIKSMADFPPSTATCDDCKCVDKCTKACEMKKSHITCTSATGQPIKCNEDRPDWIPCVSCKPDAPCSPECRERMAKAYTMPAAASKAISQRSAAPSHHPEMRSNDAQCSEPEGAENSAQTNAVVCSDAGTCDTGYHPVGKGTSTADGFIRPSEFGSAVQVGAKDGKSQGDKCAPPCPGPCNPKNDADGVPAGVCNAECGMCMKLRNCLCAMFQNENQGGQGNKCKKTNDDDCGKQKKEHAKHDKQKQDCGIKHSVSESNTNLKPCKCSKALCKKKSSYTDRMQAMMGHMRSACEDAEQAASPYIKTASVFTLDVNNQQEAISILLQKCKQKDHYIDALIDDVLERSKSNVFDGLMARLKDQNQAAPDFDGSLIMNALDKSKTHEAVCGIDLSGFKIISVKRVGATTLLVKWNSPADSRVEGYGITVNGLLKSSIASKERVYAILDALDFAGTISIEIYAMTAGGRAQPSVHAYYAKY